MTRLYAYENHQRYLARFRSQSTELNDLLDLAERLRHNCERRAFRLERLRLIWAGVISGLALILGGFCFGLSYLPLNRLSPGGQGALIAVGAAALLILATLLWKQYQHWHRQQRWYANEVAALQIVLHLLRDHEARLATDSNWSSIDQARFRVQLARYQLGGKSRQPQNLDLASTPRAAEQDRRSSPTAALTSMQRTDDPATRPAPPARIHHQHQLAVGEARGAANLGIFTPTRMGRFVLRR